MPNKNTIEKILASLEISLKSNAYYSALITDLILPDICGEIEYGNANSKERYIKWFNEYLYKYYNNRGYNNQVNFLLAENCYALRCSLLHQGITNIENQRSKQGSLSKIYFHTNNYYLGHCNLDCDSIEGLQLNVERFCFDVIKAVRTWLEAISQDDMKNNKIYLLMSIRDN